MASPFHFFRKHQKAFLVIAGVTAMVVFVFADLLMSTLGQGGGRRNNETLVTWDGGSLTGQELSFLRQRRYFVNQFLQQLQGTAAAKIEKEGGTPLRPTSIPDFILLRENTEQRAVERGCVKTHALAELAQQAGMSVSDKVINNYLVEAGLRRMGDAEISQILQGMSQGNTRAAERRLFSGLRELLLANSYLTGYGSSLRSVMPEQKWEDWLRVHDQIAVEAVVFPVAKFVSDVPEPTAAEIRSLYDEFKGNLSGGAHMVFGKRLPSPYPGFREPQRVKLQYLLGDLNAWTQKGLDAVTEEEIADYYERNKRLQFIKVAGATDEETSDKDETTADSNGSDEAETAEYEPLANVSDQIRRQLSTEKAVVEMQRAIETTYARLQTAYNAYGSEIVLARSENRAPNPPPAILANLGDTARKTGLAHETTALLSQQEMIETFVGKATDTQSRRQFVAVATYVDLQLYEPFLARDLDGNSYLVLKVEDHPTRIPELEEVEDQVIHAWKQREAAKLTLDEAKTLAEKAEKNGTTLADSNQDNIHEVITTDLFSWLSFGTTAAEAQRGARLGDAPPLEAVGPDFMKLAFGLETDKTAAVLSYDQSYAYAIRIDRRERTQDELRQLYLTEGVRWYASSYGQSMMKGHIQRAKNELLGQLYERIDLDMNALEQEYLRRDAN